MTTTLPVVDDCLSVKPLVKHNIIFLAEDDVDDQELLIDAIKSLDANTEVLTVANGNKAVGLLQTLSRDQLPNLIVLDYNLPELNGGQILEALQHYTHYKVVPKVVWSTSNSPFFKSKCIELGANAYMVKPCDMAGISNMARQMLELCATKD